MRRAPAFQVIERDRIFSLAARKAHNKNPESPRVIRVRHSIHFGPRIQPNGFGAIEIERRINRWLIPATRQTTLAM
jgi:hypothetical protein